MSNILNTGNHLGFDWKVRHNGIGYRCGYVKIPPTHPWFKKGQDEISCDVHGGLTYDREESDGYWIGFDCAHLGDARDPDLYNSELGMRAFDDGEIRSQEYVEQECKNLCEQASKVT